MGEIIWIIMALLVPVLWVIKQIADSAKPAAAEAEPAGRQRAAARAPRPQAAVGQGGGGQADPLRQQVEEFLRRAGREPAPGGDPRARQRPPQPVSEIELLIDDEPPNAPRQPLGEPLRPVESRPSAPTPQPAHAKSKPRQPRRADAPERRTVAQRMAESDARSQSFAQQVSTLGQRIAAEDEQFDVRMKARFAHSVGTLAGSAQLAPEEAPPPDTPAGQLAAMLASPEGVRQAIVLNEVLRRPSDQW